MSTVSHLSSTPCPYCSGVFGSPAAAGVRPRPRWDTVLRSHGGVVTVPTRGPLVEGWLLVIPREHVLSSLALPGSRRDLVYDEAARAAGLLREAYHHDVERGGAFVTTFEHGAARSGTPVGCGVDHVHLHAVVLPFELAAAAHQHPLGGGLRWQAVSGWRDLEQVVASNTPYVAVANDEAVWVGTGKIPNQFFRRVIAAELGHPDRFDWKMDPRNDLVDRTLAAVADRTTDVPPARRPRHPRRPSAVAVSRP
jgi:ATP adenylyltransferase